MQVDNGLERLGKFRRAERRCQIRLEFLLGLKSRLHLRLEETIRPALIRLGTIKRDVGILKYLIAVAAMSGR